MYVKTNLQKYTSDKDAIKRYVKLKEVLTTLQISKRSDMKQLSYRHENVPKVMTSSLKLHTCLTACSFL